MIHADFEILLETLTDRQHIAPHESVARSLSHVVGDLGVCPIAVEQSLGWLQVDPGEKYRTPPPHGINATGAHRSIDSGDIADPFPAETSHQSP